MVFLSSSRISRAPLYSFSLYFFQFLFLYYSLFIFLYIKFSFFQFRSPLLSKSFLFFIPAVTEMFHFAAFILYKFSLGYSTYHLPGGFLHFRKIFGFLSPSFFRNCLVIYLKYYFFSMLIQWLVPQPLPCYDLTAIIDK